MDDESEQNRLLTKHQNSDDGGETSASHSDSFCGDFRDPSSRCHRMSVVVVMCFIAFGELRLNWCN